MITAKVLKKSINPRGTVVTTFELEYPRIVHQEFLTHRLLSRNSASSRAIPVMTMLEQIEANPAMPSAWGKNQPGMQAEHELDEQTKAKAIALWKRGTKLSAAISRRMHALGLHKQVANRQVEHSQHMKVVATATDWNNFFWLRDHKDADPTIAELAHKMKNAYEEAASEELKYGEWHLPYINTGRDFFTGKQTYWLDANTQLDVKDALMLSVSCCAQVSYRKLDMQLDKAKKIYEQLIASEPCHASPTEHQAMCFDAGYYWPEGTTLRDKQGVYYSGNFRDWIQYRQLIPNNVKRG